jgi:hypothetical protein
MAGKEAGLRMELVGGIAFIIWINDKFPPQFGHMVAFKGNEYPHTSHLVLFDFSVVILALLPLRLPGTAEQHIAFPEWIFGKQMPNPFPGNATPILFNNRQQNQSNKIVVRKLPPGAFDLQPPYKYGVGKLEKHEKFGPKFRECGGKRLITRNHLPTAWYPAATDTAVS